jgi:hypothetical protein
MMVANSTRKRKAREPIPPNSQGAGAPKRPVGRPPKSVQLAQKEDGQWTLRPPQNESRVPVEATAPPTAKDVEMLLENLTPPAQ